MITKPRVVIADDHRLVADGLERLLADDCNIVSTVYDGDALLEEVGRQNLDLVVQDLSLPPGNGIDLIREVRKLDPRVRIVVVTLCDDGRVAAEALRAGAQSYVLKNSSPRELREAVACTMAHKSYVTPQLATSMVQVLALESTSRPGRHLTLRQRDVLRLLAVGKSMKEAAAILQVTTRTVAFHKYQMMRQLDIKTSAELVRYAVMQNIA